MGGPLAAMSGRRRGYRESWGRGRGGWFGPPFGGPGRFSGGPRARRGDARAAALLLLAEGPLNGYQIMQEIERRSDGVWRPSPGSVYPALAQLVDEGLISSEEQGDRRSYVLTDAGRAHLEERPDTHAAPWEQMADAGEGGPGALFGEMRRLGMAVGQIGHFGDPGQIRKARTILAEARRSLYAVLAESDDD